MAVIVSRMRRVETTFLLIVCCQLLLGGCSIFEDTQKVQLELDFAAVLPEGWEALRTWQEINVDGDVDVEYLLLFQFDNGQIGAVIYDPQSSSDYVGVSSQPDSVVTTGTFEVVTAPLQSFGFYRPYRLLPSFWGYTYAGRIGQGVVALPADANRVGAFEVRASTLLDDALGGGLGQDETDGEIVLRGGDTHLTFVWWKGIAEGYGVTQLVAPGGFDGIDWRAWEEKPTSIDRLSGLYPLADYRGRSLLCDEVHFERRSTNGVHSDEDGGAPGMQSNTMAQDQDLPTPIQFSEADMGLRFCDKIPQHPFYPEGVVMAYIALHQQNGAGISVGEGGENLLTPSITSEQVEAKLETWRVAQERVVDIETYATIPVSPSTLQSGAFSPTTTVCAELAAYNDDVTRRWLVFTLRYQPPSLAQRTSDHWTISDVATAPPPIQDLDREYCRMILELGQE